MDLSVVVVPVQGEAEITGAFPVGVTYVVFLQDFEEMVDVVLVDVLHAKVVNDEGKADGAPGVGPISWGELALAVPSDVETFFKEFLGDYAGLRKAVHASSDFAKVVPLEEPLGECCLRFAALLPLFLLLLTRLFLRIVR